jgi:hypothetical protein
LNAQSKVLERTLSKEITKHKRRILSHGIDDLPVTLIHIEVDSMFDRSSIKTPLDLEPVRTKEPLHTPIPLELLFTALVR